MLIAGMDWRVVLLEAVIFGLLCGLTYWLVKNAIRDGIKESGLVEELCRVRKAGGHSEADRPEWARTD